MRWALPFLVVAGAVAQQPPVPPEFARVSLETPAKVGLPVWLKISTDQVPVPLKFSTDQEINYPLSVEPNYHPCHDVEVRKDGKPFPRITYPDSAIGIGFMVPGNLCGSPFLPGKQEHPGSLPLHVMYRFDRPGIYEVRFVQRMPAAAAPTVTSPWTRIEIGPATPADRIKWLADVSARAPTDATSLLTGYLPDLLGVPDERSLQLLVPYLTHPDDWVRRYVSYALAYWPGDQAKRAVLAALRARGPSEDSAQVLMSMSAREIITADEEESAVQDALPYLKSDSKISLKGAIDMAGWIALRENSPVGAALKTRAVNALIDAEAHVVALRDTDIANAYAGALGRVQDDRASKILWSFVDRHIDGGQAIIALTWLHAPSDLQKLAQLALVSGTQPDDTGPPSLPSLLRQAYGEAALPYIEDLMQRSPFVRVRVESARELVLAGRPSGFAFIADAIEQEPPYRQEMIQFLRDRFPEIRQGDDTAALNLARTKANTK